LRLLVNEWITQQLVPLGLVPLGLARHRCLVLYLLQELQLLVLLAQQLLHYMRMVHYYTFHTYLGLP
jgi:hypothetical protein